MAKINRIHSAEAVARDCATWPEVARRRWQAAFAPEFGTHEWVRESQYGYGRVFTRYLEVARAQGLPDAPCALAPKGLRAFLRQAESSCSVRTLAGYVHHLVEVASVIYPEEARAGRLNWLWTTRDRLMRRAARAPKKRRRKVVPAGDLLRVAVQAINEGRARDDFVRLRTGVFVLLGVFAPERRRALEGLDLGMIDFDAGEISWPAGLIKTREPVVRAIPARVVAVLEAYVADWRTRFAAPCENALFITTRGTRVGGEALRAAMVTLTREKLGRGVPPHLIRNAVATTVLDADPANAILASIAIGHGSPRMTREYTETAKGLATSRQVRALMRAAEEEAARAAKSGAAWAADLQPVSYLALQARAPEEHAHDRKTISPLSGGGRVGPRVPR